MSTPVPNPPQGKGMTFSFSHAPSLIQQERELHLFSRGQPRAVRLPPQRCGSSKRKRLCFGSASHAQQSSSWVVQSYAQCDGWGWSIRRRGARACDTQPHTQHAPHPLASKHRTSCSRALREPLTGGGAPRGVEWLLHHIPRCVFPIFPKQNKAVLKTTLSVEQLTKNKSTNKT